MALSSNTNLKYNRRTDRPHLIIDAGSAKERGAQRATLLGDELRGGFGAYEILFEKAGLSQHVVRESGLRVIDDIARWRPQVVEELSGIAQSGGLELWQVAALNARTELLGSASNGLPGECSTLVYAPRQSVVERLTEPFGVQTWDWNEEQNDFWHTQYVKGDRFSYVGITEHGILGKIGVNSGGLALFLNILAHEGDGVGGIPVHILAARVLEEAGSVREAIELLRQVKLHSSTTLTLADAHEVVSVELSPVGIFEISPIDGYLLHTNHFLANGEKLREKPLYRPDTYNRFDLVSQRLKVYGRPNSHEQLLEFLYSDPDQAHLCCLPDFGAELGKRWRTLTTIVLDPVRMTANILDGSPVEQRARTWLTLSAAA
ncbi:C45 family autoproteolytic acyltransferase/hydolase [Pseudomonas putida]|uniref:C45 family autoproteolytic acyltransferase/hydolase n=1 Tax=Pseudomonas putida TaxID=303 RepID=UPI001F516BF1|nr:C45 family peptidase [Pseudomonas putida]MCI1035875.1 penicillin acyltransferase [Pseudomonas putida]